MNTFKEALLAWLDRASAFIAESRALEVREPALKALADAKARVEALDRPLRAVLLGGTGVGKSSLINAIAGRAVSEASRRRPTTAQPAAYVHAAHAAEAADFAPEIRAEAHGEEELRHLVLVDMPDFDSRATEHRALVDRILPRADFALWVVDPDKYNDGLLHREYLSREAKLRERFVVVFNKADALPREQLNLCLDDLTATLRGDGIPAPQIFAVSALQGAAHAGFAEFAEFLRTKFTEKFVRELKAADVFRFLQNTARAVGDALALPGRLEQLRAEEAALSGRQEEFLRWLRIQLGPDIFTRDLTRAIRDRFRDRFASLLPGPVGMVAEWRFRPAAVKDWRELAGQIRIEAGAAAGQKVHSRIWNDHHDAEAFFRKLPEICRPPGAPDQETFAKMKEDALLRLEEELAREHEGQRWRGKGKVAQHVLPATAAGGCGAAAATFATELAAAGALFETIAAAGIAPIGLYFFESILARRDVSRAAREVAERAADHFRTSLEAIYRRSVTIPLLESFEKVRGEYSAWRSLHAELEGLVK
ncbi:MAG: GTPase [Planctomycetota bacterium]